MALLKRADVSAPPDLAREIISVPALGGDVAVVELDLGARLEFEDMIRARKPARADGKDLVGDMVPQLLAMSVVADEDEPLFNVKQWRAWAARNRGSAIELFNAAMRLSGFDAAENAKN